MKYRIALAFVALAALAASSCASSPSFAWDDGRLPGEPASLEWIGDYAPGDFDALAFLGSAFFEPTRASSGARLYRLRFWTLDPAGEPALSSGLVAIPTGGVCRGSLVYLHGTIVDRKDSPSAPGFLEGVLVSMLYAGGGYLVLAPDYLGLGDSALVQPYLIAAAASGTSRDMLRAAARALPRAGAELPPNPFIVGYSQGGHSALALARELQEAGEPARAVATCAGAYALVPPAGFAGGELCFENAYRGNKASHCVYLCCIAAAYSRWYGFPMEEVLRPQWAERARDALDGDHSMGAFASLFAWNSWGREILEERPSELFQPAFSAAFEAWLRGAGDAPRLVRLLADNAVLGWKPKSPLRLYYGDKDLDVPPLESVNAAAALGPRAEALSLGPVDHAGSILAVGKRIRDWFDSMSQ